MSRYRRCSDTERPRERETEKGKGGSDGRKGVSLRERAIRPKTTDPVTHHCFI